MLEFSPDYGACRSRGAEKSVQNYSGGSGKRIISIADV